MIMSYQRIATEEAFATTEQLRLYRRMLTHGTIHDPGFLSLWGFYLQSPSERATQIIERLQNIDSRHIADMDATGISLQILSLTSPGVQVCLTPPPRFHSHATVTTNSRRPLRNIQPAWRASRRSPRRTPGRRPGSWNAAC